jgi:Ser/Thr protein kinase RdoA (MazF antagonist)
LLTPDCVINALNNVGFRSDGRLLALNSYENRVYQVGMENGPSLVAKFYRSGRWEDSAILEEHAFVQELVEREIPVIAALTLGGHTLHTFEGFRFAVFPKNGGRAPELEDKETLEWMGRFIGRIHAIGALKPFECRFELNVERFGVNSLQFLMENNFVHADLCDTYCGVVEQALVCVRHCFERAGKDIKRLRLHGDCHAGNVLWTDNGPHFVDFDDSCMGPAIQDLWMLLSGERADMTRQLSDILNGYDKFYHFDLCELHLIEALRTLRLINYSAWLAKRWDDPAFKWAFPWFGTQHYWQDRILELREQISLMNEAPLCL